MSFIQTWRNSTLPMGTEAVSWVQDIAGGLVVTGPSEEDWLNPQTRPYIERFLGGSQGVEPKSDFGP